jgi:hypothetical protein
MTTVKHLPEPVVDELAMLVRKLVRHVRKASPDNNMATMAMDYLQRKGLAGSPLRDAAPQQPAQSAEQDERAAFLSGRDVEELFLCWSEWTTELGEAISCKNIDGFVSDLRAILAAQPVSGGKS